MIQGNIDLPDLTTELSQLAFTDYFQCYQQIAEVDADKHYLLQKSHGVGDTYRYLIFLEDWQSGHYFEIYNQPLVAWRRGDWIKFHRDEWHLAGNMGTRPFFSAQVTVK